MTGLWLEYLFWDEKAIQMLPRRMPSRRRAAPGPCGAAPREILITNWIDREGRFLPQDMRLWKAERESRALGTRSGNCLYVKSFKLFKHWENKDMRCKCCKDKGEKIRRESHHRREMEAEPGRAPWDGRQGDRPLVPGWADSLSSLFSTGDF